MKTIEFDTILNLSELRKEKKKEKKRDTENACMTNFVSKTNLLFAYPD